MSYEEAIRELFYNGFDAGRRATVFQSGKQLMEIVVEVSPLSIAHEIHKIERILPMDEFVVRSEGSNSGVGVVTIKKIA